MVFQRGDVVLVPFPFSNLSTTKVRPAVVVSSQSYHELEPDIILAAITSKIVAASGPFDHILQDWHSAGLRFSFGAEAGFIYAGALSCHSPHWISDFDRPDCCRSVVTAST